MKQVPEQPFMIIASNRGPVSFSRDENGEQTLERGSGGLVTALSGLASQIDVTWVSCAMTSGRYPVAGRRIRYRRK